jgi:hypothetical protein
MIGILLDINVVLDVFLARVRVHGPRVTVVQQRTRCGRVKADPADMGPEATPEARRYARTNGT